MGSEAKSVQARFRVPVPAPHLFTSSTPSLAIFSFCGVLLSQAPLNANLEIWTYRIEFDKAFPSVKRSSNYEEYHSAVQEWVNYHCEYFEVDRIRVHKQDTLNYKFNDRLRAGMSEEMDLAYATVNSMNVLDKMGTSLCTVPLDRLETVVYTYEQK